MSGGPNGLPDREAGTPILRPAINIRELLERVLPLDQLPPIERFRVQHALQSGLARELEAAGLMAIERL